ncbi:substrate-binding domain-containing protein [Saccharothrix violaceirubra]|uniref:Ca-activated chloride channel family protein n=1 Tax=Saccharothrix violaceirubra TaxID=413306 RepID=A0A7W7T2B2_9PSEU|nr:VWA domain-containing protein [Saccharothrix violaceirubra]MBB4965226.1 Ca-activated chloride channel family protein [Saccharothrix violaceirubra]
MRKALAAALVVLLAATGCADGPEADPIGPARPGVLRVLASSELADLQPVLDEAAKATGVEVRFAFTGTLEGAEALAKGEVDGKYDAVWFSSNRYLSGVPEAAKRLGTATGIAGSPVVLGLAESTAKRLGWTDRRPGWKEIAETAGRGGFRYGMTDPSASNSGFSALVAVASALVGTGTVVDAAGIEAATPGLKAFFGAQALSAGSSGWLSEAYARRSAEGEAKVDGLVNYESVLLSLNDSGTLPEPLRVIYPSDGVVSADYPLTLLTSAGDDARESHRRLGEYLRTPAAQKRIVETTARRPAVPGVDLDGRFAVRDLVELPFPTAAESVDALLTAYFDELRRPSRTLYVLDTSGSMAGDRIAGLRSALVGLTGADGSITGRFRRFRNREEVTLLPFNTGPGSPSTFTVPDKDPGPELARIKSFAEGLGEGGGTAIYDSLAAAYRVLGPQLAKDPDRFTSIVLMTDGENSNGSDLDDFKATFGALTPQLKRVPVFTVLFGEGSGAELGEVAAMTGGKVFDAREVRLGKVFQEIRGYQ